MKFLRILPIAALAITAVSCQNGGSGLSENSTSTDSLMYYMGQLRGIDYMRQSNVDTTMKEATQKQAFVAGLTAGLNALKENQELYNQGYMMGVQLSQEIINYSENMGVTIDKNVFINSLSATINADTLPNASKIQNDFRLVMANIEAQKEAADKAASQESLAQEAEKDKLPRISDDLYGKVTVKNDSTKLKDGDEVAVKAQITKMDGENIYYPIAPKGTIGNKRSFNDVVKDALLSLKSGETGEFLTTAHALFGMRAKQMGLEATDVVKMTVTGTLIPKAEEPKEEKTN